MFWWAYMKQYVRHIQYTVAHISTSDYAMIFIVLIESVHLLVDYATCLPFYAKMYENFH
jgi:hypothetical protein